MALFAGGPPLHFCEIQLNFKSYTISTRTGCDPMNKLDTYQHFTTYHTIILAVFFCMSVCLFVCSPTPPRSFNGSSPNLVGVCRWTSELPLRGSFLKRSTGQRVKCHFFGEDDTRLRPHHCKRHTASFAEHGIFCPAKGTQRLRV